MTTRRHIQALTEAAYRIILEIPVSRFISGYQKAGDKPKKREDYTRYSFVVTDWQIVRRRAEAYWKALWHLLGWFSGTLLPSSTIMGFLAFGTFLAWVLAIIAAVVWMVRITLNAISPS